ncbi:MAG: glycosyltransferase family 4 protein [Deltaproteobacteria bacterium]|nr:glycosyltransferase family 4 protein [Deltaproteobacteria bacterium]
METASVLIGFFVGAAGASFVSVAGKRLAPLDMPNERSSHTVPTPRGGGIGIVLAFLIAGVFVTGALFETTIGFGMGLLGFVEDSFTLSPSIRLALELLISAVVALPFEFTFFGAALFVFWTIFMTGTANFYNFMDGINGIAGLTGVTAFTLLSVFSFLIGKDHAVSVLSLAVAAACLGFLPFNMPRARTFMGDSGSMFLGFLFALFAYRLTHGLGDLICMGMFLSLFYADATVTLYLRFRRGERISSAHRSHLYQYLANELGYPHWAVSIVYCVLQLLIGAASLAAYYGGILWQTLVVAAFSLAFIAVYRMVKEIKPRGNVLSETIAEKFNN